MRVSSLEEMGYVQQSREEMEVLFTLLAERYERGVFCSPATYRPSLELLIDVAAELPHCSLIVLLCYKH
jgi:hypothetical protein